MQTPKYKPNQWIIGLSGKTAHVVMIVGAIVVNGSWRYDVIKPGTDIRLLVDQRDVLCTKANDAAENWIETGSDSSARIVF